jgi:hypothetical protein
MADLAYRNDIVPVRRRTDWGAIWAGVFTFIAVWSVFGLLGEAIFASTANPNAAHPVTGMRRVPASVNPYFLLTSGFMTFVVCFVALSP